MRIIKIGMFLCLGLAVALAAVRFVFLDQIVEYSLQKVGIDGHAVHVSRVDWTQVHIDRLTATHQLANGDNYSVILIDASLHYDLLSLLAGSKEAQIDIAKLIVNRDRAVQKSPSSFVFPQEIILLKDKLRQKLPMKQLLIST